MSEPKYAIGQAVAVCGKSAIRGVWVVVPQARIRDRCFVDRGIHTQLFGVPYKTSVARWSYLLEQPGPWVPEYWLRPIDPDEYQEVQDQQQKERQQ